MFEFFEKLEALAPENEERLPDKRVDKIKASVLSRIEEDKPMKKHFTIKPLLIAAAITATGAVSALSAGAVTTPAVSEKTLPAVTAEIQPAAASSQPAAADTPAVPENDPKPDTTSERAESPDELADIPTEDLQNYGRFEKVPDMEFIGEDDNGVRHYKTASGETVSLRVINADEENVCFYYYEF